MSDTEALLARIEGDEIRIVDFRFTDLTGRWRHTSMDAACVTGRLLDDGFFIDGSQLPGWRDPNEPDILLRPDPATAYADPFSAQPTLILVCDGAEPATGMGYERDPRSIAARAEAWLGRQPVADRVRIAIELACFILEDLREAPNRPPGDPGALAAWAGHPGYRPAPGAARFATPPADRQADIRSEITALLASLGFTGLRHDHGAAPAQARFGFAGGPLVATADRIQIFKDVVQHVAASYGKAATFMARPLAGEPGSGMSVQQSLWQGERPVFAGTGYADLSAECLAFIAGVIQHGRALNAFTNPTTNSYRRLRPGAEEPVYLAYAAYNRSAGLRIPFAATAEGKCVEARFPDASANPYLAFTAILMAGLDGIAQKLEPGDAMDRNLYDLRAFEIEDLRTTAPSLPAALDALEADHEFLLKGDVFSAELIRAYVEVKRAEVERIEAVPHPAELELYFGA